jgi:hypothetical protein
VLHFIITSYLARRFASHFRSEAVGRQSLSRRSLLPRPAKAGLRRTRWRRLTLHAKTQDAICRFKTALPCTILSLSFHDISQIRLPLASTEAREKPIDQIRSAITSDPKAAARPGP